MEFYKPEKPKSFPEWVRNPAYLPSMQDLKNLHKDGLWDDYIHHSPHGNEFQTLTREFIDSLSDLLIKEIDKLPKNPVSILEVGAGGGRLTYFLKEAVENKLKDREVIFKAVDDYSWDGHQGSLVPPFWIKRIFPVEEISTQKALENNPDIVISSWMPQTEDWTRYFRENGAVQAFILIGKEDDCGTKASWQADDKFQRIDTVVDGTVCWDDMSPYQTKSQVVMFSRQE